MSLPPEYFDDLYSRSPDPWGFTDRWYEQRKRALTLAALPAQRYRSGLEVGCSIGVLTAELAGRCDRLLALDASAAAVAAATARCAGLAGVTVAQRVLPAGWPHGQRFDLVVLSEVGYYLTPADLGRLADDTREGLAEGGVVLACHWRHPVADYPQRGDAVHAGLAADLRLPQLCRYADDDLLLEVFGGTGRSVAAGEGLVA